jgi:hypothetical protein
MNNGIFKANLMAVVDAVLSAILVAAVGVVVAVVTSKNFDIFNADWVTIGKSVVNASVFAGVVVLGKNILSTDSGSLLNVGPTASNTLK